MSAGETRAPWRFGVEPLGQTKTFASLLRRVTGLALSAEDEDPVIDHLIEELRRAELLLSERTPADPAPRVGPDASGDQRVYVDHSRDIGSYNPFFPEYLLDVAGDRASGSVTFPVGYEGPPGIVHGGFLALFFDCVIQHHNCEVGQTGKTVSLALTYRRPAPLLKVLGFEITRAEADSRITSTARLTRQGATLCTATVEAVCGDRSRLPEVLPRRAASSPASKKASPGSKKRER